MKKYLIPTILALTCALGTMSFAPVKTGYNVGDTARQFSLINIDHKWVSPQDYTDAKGLIVTFTCNHCPFAKMYESRIEALNQEFASKGFPVLAISASDPKVVPEDSFDNMVALAKDHHYSFPYLFDDAQGITRAYGATNTPEVFVLSKENGKLIVRYIGAIDDNAQEAKAAKTHYVEDAVNALLAGKPVPVAKTKAIGCGIKISAAGC